MTTTNSDAVALTRSLLSFQTVMGHEADCARMAGAMLREWGYAVDYYDFQEGRTSVVARAGLRTRTETSMPSPT